MAFGLFRSFKQGRRIKKYNRNAKKRGSSFRVFKTETGGISGMFFR